MRALKLAGLATAMVLPLTAGAFAADAIMAPPSPPPAAAPVEAAPVQLWTGPYAGVFLGYNWGDHEDIIGDDSDGISGGAYAGYNYQFDNFVVGAEADIGYSDVSGDGIASVAGVTTAREGEVGLFGSVRARAGVAFNPFLIYATGGVAMADVEYNQFDGSDSQAAIGYTVGGGVEGMVTDNITARLEYRYTDYGSDDYSINGNSFSSAYDEHSVRAGVGFKF